MHSPSATVNDASTNLPAANRLRAAAVMAVLQSAGVRMCVLSPGSRSAPLVLAAVCNSEMEVFTCVDERSAAFIALGHARRSGRPVALVCTSGSAPAHYLPALVEATEAGIPLVVLSADRPPELRDCAAGQTIDQINLFGKHARYFVDCELPQWSAADVNSVRAIILEALAAATGDNPGPVHINMPFCEPLLPEAEEAVLADPLGCKWLEAATAGVKPHLQAQSTIDSAAKKVAAALPSLQRGLIIVGAHPPAEGGEAFADAVLALSRQVGWPVFADAASALRYHPQARGQVLAHYDVLLRDDSIAQDLQAEVVLQFGALPTGKILRQWLAGLSAQTLIVDPRPRNLDPLARPHQRIFSTARALAEAVTAAGVEVHESKWLRDWCRLDTAAAEALSLQAESNWLSAESFCEPCWPSLLARALEGVECDLHFASSMPVRDAEWFISSGSLRGEGFSNRGANGIDGTLSSALGAAHGGRRPLLLICGDLAFLHDTNALLSAPRFKGSLTVLLIDNGGGRIFESLPVARHEAVFESYFATPQNVNFPALAAAYGVSYADLTSVTAVATLRQAVGQAGIHILRLGSDNGVAMQTRRECFAAMTRAAREVYKQVNI